MAGTLRSLAVLLHRNWLLKRRNPISTLMEVVLPVTVMLLLMLLQSKTEGQTHPTSEFIAEKTFTRVGKSKESPSFDSILTYCAGNNSRLGIAPDNPSTRRFLLLLSERFPLLENVSLVFPSESSLESYVRAPTYGAAASSPRLEGALVFHAWGPRVWDYSIRLNHTWAPHGFPNPRSIMDMHGPYTNDLARGLGQNFLPQLEYGLSGFLTLQQVVDAYVLYVEQRSGGGREEKGGVPRSHLLPLSIGVAPFPVPEYTEDSFQQIAKSVLGILFVLAFLFPVSRLLRSLVLEKERRIRESLRMMGLRDAVATLAGVISMLLQFALTSALLTAVTSRSLFRFSDKSVVFVYFMAYGCSSTALCYLLSSFFSRSKTAAAVGALAFLGAAFPYFTVEDTAVGPAAKLIASLLSPTAFALGTLNVADFEAARVGLRWSNLLQPSSRTTFAASLGMMSLDCLLYAGLAWYLDQVLPQEFGVQKPWNFIFIRKGVGKRNASRVSAADEAGEGVEQPLLSDALEEGQQGADSADVEAVPVDLQQQSRDGRCLQLRGLRKVYEAHGRRHVAVQGLWLTAYEGQVLALLGHNGAGKSTAIGMITGLTPPTEGDALVLGQSVRAPGGVQALRRSLGMCFQYDALYSELTVREHLVLAAALKGVAPERRAAEAAAHAAEVGLAEKADAPAGALSGGMRRKLSVALALVGGSRVVVLDEPTSGMDPYTMRATWTLLRKAKKGRVILLTTHSMEEADVLGDRIAIMAGGRLRCCGSALFLKQRFGVGYSLTGVKADRATTDVSALEGAVKRHVPAATLVSHAGAEVAFRLPLASTPSFQGLLRELDESVALQGRDALGLAGYGLSVTTLEEVFLRVAAQESEGEGQEKEVPLLQSTAAAGAGDWGGETVVAGLGGPAPPPPPPPPPRLLLRWCPWVALFGLHVRALLLKRAAIARRDGRALVLQLLVPALFLLLGLGVLTLKPNPDQPAVTLTTKFFNPGWGGGGPLPLNLSLPIALQVAMELRGSWVQAARDVSFRFPDASAAEATAMETAGARLGPSLMRMSEFLLNSSSDVPQSRYGAVVFEDRHWDPSGSVGYTVLWNESSQHAAPTYINRVHDALLRVATGDEGASLSTRNHPLPQSIWQRRQRRDINAFAAAIITNVALSFIPASFAIAIVKEREVRAKQQQLLSGVSLTAYWLSTFLWDTLSYVLPGALALSLFFAFGIDEFVSREALPSTAALLAAYGPATAAFTYCLTFAFADHSTAQNVVLLVHFFTGLVLMAASFIMSLIPATKSTNTTLKCLFRVFPGFCLADGLTALALRSGSLRPGERMRPADWEVAGADVTHLAVEALVYLALALVLEYVQAWPRAWARTAERAVGEVGGEEEPEDVAAERRRVHGPEGAGCLVRLLGLRKVYPGSLGRPGKVAVQSLSFGVSAGECLGFLGVNGAGKTTTMEMLSGELAPSAGTAELAGSDIQRSPAAARRRLGYCPQYDPLLELLSVREHLELFARLKDMPEARVAAAVGAIMRQLDLRRFADTPAGALSGGNKRKLSVGIALVGDPPLVFLDEPSAGMDPAARRFLWDALLSQTLRAGRCAMLLTTHSMAEAQALCTRIGIMGSGRLRCVGTPQELKSKFGRALDLEVKAAVPTRAEIRALQRALVPLLAREVAVEDAHGSAGLCIPCDAMGAAVAVLSRPKGTRGPSTSGSLPSIDADSLARQLAHNGLVPVLALCKWWELGERLHRIDAFVRASFAGVVLLERNGFHSRYQLPFGATSSTTLASVFGMVEQHKSSLGIAEYSVGQTTLEAIFNGLAAQQDQAHAH